MTWRAYCGGREIGPDYPTREAAIRAVRAYRKHYPSCRYLIRQVKQYWGFNIRVFSLTVWSYGNDK